MVVTQKREYDLEMLEKNIEGKSTLINLKDTAIL